MVQPELGSYSLRLIIMITENMALGLCDQVRIILKNITLRIKLKNNTYRVRTKVRNVDSLRSPRLLTKKNKSRGT
jgi:hypothetical protein